MGREAASSPRFRILTIEDERDALAEQAFELIRSGFPPEQLHQTGDLRLSLETARRKLSVDVLFHIVIAVDEDGAVAGAVSGSYIATMNFGFVGYLVVRGAHLGVGLGRRLRSALIETFRLDARTRGHHDLAWVVGEVAPEKRWLRYLIERRGALPFPVRYHQPALSDDAEPVRFVLYREPVSDFRDPLPRQEVARLLYTIYRRIYSVAQPLRRSPFRAMIDSLQETGAPDRSIGG